MSASVPRWKPIAVAAAAALLVAGLGGTITELGAWYQGLEQPSWKPPDWLFGPAWTLIFGLAAASAVVGWRAMAGQIGQVWLVGLFCLNGTLNILWSWLFFRFQRPDLALAEVTLLWLSVLALMILLYRKSRTASLLLLPYLLWVAFAAMLNLAVVRLNGPF